MRQLLYIPSGSYITICIDKKPLSIEEYINYRNSYEGYTALSWSNNKSLTEESVINAIISNKFSDDFYERNDLLPKYLTRQMFEVVDN